MSHSSSKRLDHTQGHMFRTPQGDVFYSPNSSRRVEVPPDPFSNNLNNPCFSREAKLEAFSSPRWFTDAFGYLSFITLRPTFDGAFGCLHDILSYVNQYSEQGKYTLSPRRIDQWLHLEDLLIMTIHLLKTKFHVENKYPSLNPVPPSFLGFKKAFNTIRSTRLRAAASRDWFLVWMALLSYIIADVDKHRNAAGDWFGLLASENMPQHWLSSLQSSIVFDFSSNCARVGAFLDILSPTRRQPPVEWFWTLNVPVWYRWSAEHERMVEKKPSLGYLRPPQDLWQAATTFISSAPSSFGPTSGYAYFSLPTTNEHPALAPEQSPTQSYHDVEEERKAYIATKPWTSFFKHREELNKKKLLTEKPKDRQTRENRERQNPTISAEVFVWDWSLDKTVELVRIRVGRKEREDVLGFHSGAQRIYNSFSNQWDVCEYFGLQDDPMPTEDFSDEEDEYDEYNAHETQYGQESHHPHTSNAAAEHEVFIQQRVHEAAAILQHDNHMSSSAPFDTTPDLDLTHGGNKLDILQYVNYHYGFVPPLPIPEEDSSPIKPQDWDECMKSIGLRAGNHNPPIPGLSGPVIHFIRGLQGRGPPIQVDEWDLLPGNRIMMKADVVRSVFAKLSDNLFLLHPAALDRNKPSPWQIAVTNSVDALYVVRYLLYSEPSAASLATHLAEEGIRFRTLLKLEPNPSSISLNAIITKIPRRVAGYKFGPPDYHAYVTGRARFFLSPRARAAILEGGMIGRLAREHLGIDAGGLGPSSAVTIHRLGYSYTDSAGATYWDDKLTDDEVAVICGLHKCYTGNGDQIAEVSWWPLPRYWDNKANGFNWRHWTEWDEVWYQDRLLAVLSGDKKRGIPFSQSKWRDKLKGATTWRSVTARILEESNKHL